jgi:hypothetical protein
MFNLNTQPLIAKIDEFTKIQQQNLACLQAIQASLNRIEQHLKEK